MSGHRRRVLAAALLAGALGLAAAQTAPAADGCIDSAQALPVEALYGLWEARFEGEAASATVRLAAHPEYAGGVRGTIARGEAVAQLAGDIDDEGLLVLDESQDGRAISAVWSGQLQPGACGRAFTGTWRRAADEATRSFELRKTGTWQ